MSAPQEPSSAAPAGGRATEDPAPGAQVAVPVVNRPEVVAEVTEVFERYERALVANDVEVLVELFWDSDLTNRYGIDEGHRGHAAIAGYRREQAMATPPRDLRGTAVTTFGDDVAVVDTEFLPHGSDAVGRQSQTWIRTSDGWRVASAHVSWLSGRAPG